MVNAIDGSMLESPWTSEYYDMDSNISKLTFLEPTIKKLDKGNKPW